MGAKLDLATGRSSTRSQLDGCDGGLTGPAVRRNSGGERRVSLEGVGEREGGRLLLNVHGSLCVLREVEPVSAVQHVHVSVYVPQ